MQKARISHADVVVAMTGLLCMGKPDYEAIELFRNNPFFSQSLGLTDCPSSPTLRQRIDFIDNSFDSIITEESADLIRQAAPKITPIETGCGEFAPMRADVSPFDNSRTKKEGIKNLQR